MGWARRPAPMLAALLLLVAVRCAAAQEAGGPGSSPALASPDPVVPRTLEEVRRAYQSSDSAMAAAGARTLLEEGKGLSRYEILELHLVECESLLHERRFPESVAAADRGRKWLGPASPANAAWTGRFSLAKSWSLLHMGRVPEARETLDDWTGSDPKAFDSENALRLRGVLRLLLREADGPLVDTDYRGRFQGDPRVSQAFRRLECAFPLAVEQVRRKLDEPDLAIPRTVILIQDSLSLDQWMCAEALPVGESWCGEILVRASLAVEGPEEEAAALAHELVHVMRTAGRDKPPIPAWMEEGIAHWVGEETESEMWSVLLPWAARNLSNGSIFDLVDLVDPSSPWAAGPLDRQRVQGMLFLRYLERVRGREPVRAFIRSLIHGTGDPPEAFRSAFHAEVGEMQRELHRGLRKWIRAGIDGADELDALIGPNAPRNRAVHLQALEAFLREHPWSVAAPGVRMHRTYLHFRAVGPNLADRDARECREQAMNSPHGRRFFLPLEFEEACDRKDRAEVLRLAERMLRAEPPYPESGRAALDDWTEWAKGRGRWARESAAPSAPSPVEAPR